MSLGADTWARAVKAARAVRAASAARAARAARTARTARAHQGGQGQIWVKNVGFGSKLLIWRHFL